MFRGGEGWGLFEEGEGGEGIWKIGYENEDDEDEDEGEEGERMLRPAGSVVAMVLLNACHTRAGIIYDAYETKHPRTFFPASPPPRRRLSHPPPG